MQNKNPNYSLVVCNEVNRQTILVGRHTVAILLILPIISPFEGALYPEPMVAEGISSVEQPKEVRKNLIATGKIPIMQGLQHVHALVQNLFPQEQRSDLPVAGRLKHFLKNWKVLTSDPHILEIVEGYQIPFLSIPQQVKPPAAIQFSEKDKSLIDLEIQGMLEKGAIRIVKELHGQFLSPLFLVEKKDAGYRPVVNLKKLNRNIPYVHFKMEGLSLLKELLSKGDYLCKLDLKDAYFTVALHKLSRKYVRVPWRGNLYEFLCLCFGLGPAPRIFTKLMKIPIALMRRLNVRLIIYLDDMLLMGSSLEEIMMARDTLIFILLHLGFVINFQKSILTPCHQIQFLGVEIDSITMTISLPLQKKEQIILQCKDILNQSDVSLRQLTQLIGRLSSTAIAILPAPLQYRALQRQQILELAEKQNFHARIVLSEEVRAEIQWWIENLMLSKGKAIISQPPQLVITSDASMQGWGAACQGQTTGGPWTLEEQKNHINILELKAAQLAILTFTYMHPQVHSIHLQTDNMVALSYIVKMGGPTTKFCQTSARRSGTIYYPKGSQLL